MIVVSSSAEFGNKSRILMQRIWYDLTKYQPNRRVLRLIYIYIESFSSVFNQVPEWKPESILRCSSCRKWHFGWSRTQWTVVNLFISAARKCSLSWWSVHSYSAIIVLEDFCRLVHFVWWTLRILRGLRFSCCVSPLFILLLIFHRNPQLFHRDPHFNGLYPKLCWFNQIPL